jgi:hypothetical protein
MTNELEKLLIDGALWAGVGTIVGLALGLSRGRTFTGLCVGLFIGMISWGLYTGYTFLQKAQAEEDARKARLNQKVAHVESASAPVSSNNLTPEQLSGVVTISGEGGSGTGFFCQIRDKVFIFTNQHVLSGNKDSVFKTQAGEIVPIETMFVADSADIALVKPKNVPAGVKPFELLDKPDINSKKDNLVIVPGNSKGDGVITQTSGKLIAIGPQRVETDNPVYPGNSGSPVIHIATGKILGILTEAELLTLNEFEKASFRNKQSAIQSEIRYFSHRVDTISKWQALDWEYFQENDALLTKSREEVEFLLAYLTDSSDSYKNFKELHTARNRAEAIWNSKYSESDKLMGTKRFFRDIEGLAKAAQLRLQSRKYTYSQREQIVGIDARAKAILEAMEIASRDTDLAEELIFRGPK